VTTLAALKADICRYPDKSPEYVAKMLHDLPPCPEVDRTEYILGHARGKRVLDIGATGALHEAIATASADCQGISLEYGPGVWGYNLDDEPELMPIAENREVIVVGEVLEHLSNPGRFLKALHGTYGHCPAIFSVPNAFSEIARQWAKRGVDNVNLDHVAWHSPKTLETLLSRAGYRPVEWACYNGASPLAEGWIVRCEP
jgi:2-polyprenyl-3-methyl-5-hydroxy-6-metoxy-1,4-benzoquinol methylase